jgi:hypothetical protein
VKTTPRDIPDDTTVSKRRFQRLGPSLFVVALLAAVTATFLAPVPADAAPKRPVSCWATKSGDTIVVTWTRWSRDGANGFIIERARNGGTFWWAARVTTGSTAWTDANFGAAGEFTYRMRSLAADGTRSDLTSCGGSPYLDPGGAPPPPPPPPPTNGEAARQCAENTTSVLGTVRHAKAKEISGVVASSTNRWVLWTVNDGGSAAEIHAIWRGGAPIGSFRPQNVTNIDWEDLSRGPGPGGRSYLYIGDIGDNPRTRANLIVYRIPEPTVVGGSIGGLGATERFNLVYPDGRRDAETLIVDPVRGDIIVITKHHQSGISEIFVADGPYTNGVTITLRKVGELDLNAWPAVAPLRATSGDVTADGSLVAIRTYGGAVLFDRDTTKALWTAFDTGGCVVATNPEGQGESIAFNPDGLGFTTISEGQSPKVNQSN